MRSRGWPGPTGAVIVIPLLAVVLAACGADDRSSPISERVERCVDGFLERVSPEDADGTSTGELRSYVEDTYCAQFERRGWVHEDGSLSIAAHRWLEDSASCAAGETTQEAPCTELESRDRHLVLDCAILHRVRRSEVQRYLRGLQKQRTVECDDDTPLAELGTP